MLAEVQATGDRAWTGENDNVPLEREENGQAAEFKLHVAWETIIDRRSRPRGHGPGDMFLHKPPWAEAATDGKETDKMARRSSAVAVWHWRRWKGEISVWWQYRAANEKDADRSSA